MKFPNCVRTMYDIGRDMDESSATDDSEEDGDNDDEYEDEEGMAGSLGDIIKPSLLKKSGSESPDQEKQEEPIGITLKLIHNSVKIS